MPAKGESRKSKRKGDFLRAFEEGLGNVSHACKAIGITRKTYYDWIAKDEDFKEKAEHIEEASLDFAETMLKKNIRDGKEASIFFYLKTKGKSRGFTERKEYDFPSGISLNVSKSDLDL